MYLSMISAHFTRPVSLAHSAAHKPRPKSRNTGDAPSIDKSIKVNSDSIWLIYRLVGADECSGRGLVRQPSSAPSEIQFFKIYWLISNYKIHWIRLQSGQSCCGCRWSDWGTMSASWRYRRDLSIAIDTWFIIIEINSSFLKMSEPAWAAKCNAVLPSLSAKLISRPERRISWRATAKLPVMAAWINPVLIEYNKNWLLIQSRYRLNLFNIQFWRFSLKSIKQWISFNGLEFHVTLPEGSARLSDRQGTWSWWWLK